MNGENELITAACKRVVVLDTTVRLGIASSGKCPVHRGVSQAHASFSVKQKHPFGTVANIQLFAKHVRCTVGAKTINHGRP